LICKINTVDFCGLFVDQLNYKFD